MIFILDQFGRIYYNSDRLVVGALFYMNRFIQKIAVTIFVYNKCLFDAAFHHRIPKYGFAAQVVAEETLIHRNVFFDKFK